MSDLILTILACIFFSSRPFFTSWPTKIYCSSSKFFL